MTKFLVSFSSRMMIGFISIMLLQSACFAQNGGTTAPAQPTTGTQPSAAPVPAEVLKELEAMKARIAELEAQLKSMKAVETAGTPVSVNGVPPQPEAAVEIGRASCRERV